MTSSLIRLLFVAAPFLQLKNAQVEAAVATLRATDTMASPHPRREIGDFGSPPIDPSSNAANFTHGLAGVDQEANYLFVHVIIASFLALLAATLVYRWTDMVKSHMRLLFTMGQWDQRYWMHSYSDFWTTLKKHIVTAPLGRQRHNRELQLSSAMNMGTIPSRAHTILLTMYLASHVAYCLVLDWSNPNRAEILAELRGRTGVLATLSIIPTILFALRNNPLISLLRVPYDTFNLLHRWCARMVVVQAILHSTCWAVNSVSSGGMRQVRATLATSVSYQFGLVGTCVFTILLLTTGSPIRHAFYETFLNAHRLLVALALVGIYVHLDKASLPQLPWLQLCIALWAAEYVWRIARLVYYNVSRQHGFTRVTVQALPAEACRVTLDLARPWRWHPGTHVHAYIPTLAWWSSHPFSVAWAHDSTAGQSLEIELDRLPREMVRNANLRSDTSQRPRKTLARADVVAARGQDSEKRAVTLHRSVDVTSISLVIRARTGMTKALYDKAFAAPKHTFRTWGAIEGPYGGLESFSSYGTVVLFAGGVGITHCIGLVYHLMLQWQAGTSSTQKLLLVWSVPNTEALEWVRVWMDHILHMEGRRDVLKVQLFVTKPRHRGEVVSSTGSVQMFPGRCKPQGIMEKAMDERIGAVAVTSCGPGAFCDSVRSAVRGVMSMGAVDYVEESFSY